MRGLPFVMDHSASKAFVYRFSAIPHSSMQHAIFARRMPRSPTARIFSVVVMLLCVFSMQVAAADCMGSIKKLRQASINEQASRQAERADGPNAGSRTHPAPDDGSGPCAKKHRLEKGPLNAAVAARAIPLSAAILSSILPHRPAPATVHLPRLASLHAPATAPPIRIRHCTYRI
jgi:hypothetical protein